MKDQVSVTPILIRDIFSTRDKVKEVREKMHKAAKDEKRDFSKAEFEAFDGLTIIERNFDKIGQLSASLAAGGGDDFDAAGLLAGNRTGRSNRNNWWANNLHKMAAGTVDSAAIQLQDLGGERGERRDITVTNSPGVVQNPLIMDTTYDGTLPISNPLTRLGVRMSVDQSNYQQYPYASGMPVVSYISEGDSITADTAWTVAGRKATFGTAVCLIKVSRQMMMDQPQAGAFVQQELMNAFGDKIVTDFMQGTGSGQPTGIDNLTGVNTVDLAGSAFDWSDFTDWTSTLVANRVDPARIGWIGGAKTLAYTNNLLDSTNQPRQKPPVLMDQEFFWTSAVKEDYPSTRTRIYGGDFGTVEIVFRQSVGQERPGYGGLLYLDQLYAQDFQVGYLAYLNFDIVYHYPSSLIRIDGVPLT